MNRLKITVVFWVLLCFLKVSAEDYKASMFGIKSNGTTLNTTAIQKAIDFIHEKGGGRLVFYVGRYLTGNIQLKSNVSIQLEEGAILVGSTNIYDYNINTPYSSLVFAYQSENIGINGKGVIDGQGREVANNLIDQIHKGVLVDELKNDRPATRRPRAIYFRECKNVEITGIMIKNSAEWVQVYDQCQNLKIDKITVDSKAFWNNDGLDIVDCKEVKVTNSFFDASDDAICFKSHDATKMCENVEVRNCVARSSANGIKFGTVTSGGYKNFKIINNKVYDTYRSAITIATPDGGSVDNVLIDSLYAYNTGNAIFLRIGARWNKGRAGSMNNITIQNMYAEIPNTKPDAGYAYEGPVEDLPRNISPASIVGLPGQDITNVTLRNIRIIYPGGSNPNYAFRGIKSAELDSIPEMKAAYPEFSQFKELPAWGFYVRHAKNVTIQLNQGATLLGSTNPFDYIKDKKIGWMSMIFAVNQENIGITGKGTINGRGFITANNMVSYIHRGIYNDPLKLDRPNETNRPQNIYFRECKNVTITGITLRDPASWNQTYDHCRNLTIFNCRNKTGKKL